MVLDALIHDFNGRVAFRERRPGVLQVLAPLFHEDGDMVDIFLDEPVNGSGKVRIGDHGLTLMRLTYTCGLDTENKQRIFNRILSENRIQEKDGRLYIEAEPERLYPALLQFAQTIAKVSSMQYYKREVIQNLFYEQLAEFVEEKLAAYNPRRSTLPIPDRDEYEVDYQFDIGPRPLFSVLRERNHEEGPDPDHQCRRQAVSVARRLPGERPAVLRTRACGVSCH